MHRRNQHVAAGGGRHVAVAMDTTSDDDKDDGDDEYHTGVVGGVVGGADGGAISADTTLDTVPAPIVCAPLVHSWHMVRGTLERHPSWLRRGIRPIVTVYVDDVALPRQSVPYDEFEEDGRTWIALHLDKPLSEGQHVSADATYVDNNGRGRVVARSARSAVAVVDDYPIELMPTDGAPLSSDEELMIERITNFFSRNLVRDRIVPTIRGTGVFALRDVVWAVTNYFADKHVRVAVPEESRPILLGDEYVIWRRRYRKKKFDQYARERHYRVSCSHDNRIALEISLGQLVFLEYCVRYLVLDYVAEHIDEIKAHRDACMGQRMAEKEECDENGVKYKRHPLVECRDEPIQVFAGDARVYF